MAQHETDADGGEAAIERLLSHVPGLDEILCGGFLQGGLYLVQGHPGTGKTLLANQIVFNHAAKGCRALFLTVLGENHGRMMAHLRPMRFFDPARIPDQVTYISAYQAVDQDGLEGLATLIRREVLARGATLLVLDGMSVVGAKAGAGSAFEMKRFTHELQTLASATNCTMFLLTTAPAGISAPENTMVDGLIELCQHRDGVRNERRAVVHKLRGSVFLEGEHPYRITRDGISVFPRLEALLAIPTRRDSPPRTRVSSGVASLDALILAGGLPAGSMTAVVGPTGSGKTTFALQFLARSSAAEPGLWFGCFEPPEHLRVKAATMGLDLAGAEGRGEVEMLWHPVGEHILDELAHRLLDAVRRRGVKRLVIDGLASFEHATFEPERIVRFWSALANELRALGVTTLHTLELTELIGPGIHVPAGGLSALSEVMVLLRCVELHSRLFRLISLFKMREGEFDPTIREFAITDAGIVVGKPFEGVEAVLTGIAREAQSSAAVTSAKDHDRAAPGGTGEAGAQS